MDTTIDMIKNRRLIDRLLNLPLEINRPTSIYLMLTGANEPWGRHFEPVDLCTLTSRVAAILNRSTFAR